MEEQEIFDFDGLEQQTKKVKFKGKRYEVREASADAAAQFRNHGLRSARFADGKLLGMGDVANGQSLLVSLCLWEEVANPSDPTQPGFRPVDIKVVRAWPERVVKELFEWISKVSMLDEADTEEVLEKRISELQKKLQDKKDKKKEKQLGNSPDGTDPGSDSPTS